MASRVVAGQDTETKLSIPFLKGGSLWLSPSLPQSRKACECGYTGTLRCSGEEQLENGKTVCFLGGHGNHSLKSEEGERRKGSH